MKYCSKCGVPQEDDVLFCAQCGAPMRMISTPQEDEPTICGDEAPSEEPQREQEYRTEMWADPHPTADGFGTFQVPDKKKSLAPLIVTIVTVLLVLAGGVAAFFLFGNGFFGTSKNANDENGTEPTTKPTNAVTSFTATEKYAGIDLPIGKLADGIVMTIDGKEVDEKLFRAMLYDTFSYAYYQSGLYQYEQYGVDVWNEKFPYGEDKTKVSLEEYISLTTKDALIRQVVVKRLLEANSIVIDQEEVDSFAQSLVGADEKMAAFGFDKDSYLQVGIAMLEETTLFYNLYGEGGAKAVSEEELLAKYNETNMAYYMTSYSVDELTDAQRSELESLLAQCETTDDLAALFGKDALKTIDTDSGDASLVNAISSVAIGTAKIVEYTDTYGAAYVALVARVAPVAMDDSAKEKALYHLKYKEHDADVKALMAELDVKFNMELFSSITAKSFLETHESEDEKDTTDSDVTESVGTVTSVTATHYATIVIENYGTIKVALDAKTAPITVANFKKLADEGFYNGLTFHRIMEDFMMQGGDPLGNGTGGADEDIKGEFAENGVENPLSHVRGAISMARGGHSMDSASSQFFIVHKDSTFLDGKYAAFGYVVEGIEVVDAICTDAEPTDDNGTIPAEAQPVITSITVTKA